MSIIDDICESNYNNYGCIVNNGSFQLVKLISSNDWERVLKLDDPTYFLYYAMYVPGANIQLCQEKIIESGNANVAYYFVKHIKGANLESLSKVIANDSYCSYKFLIGFYDKCDFNIANVYKSAISRLNSYKISELDALMSNFSRCEYAAPNSCS